MVERILDSFGANRNVLGYKIAKDMIELGCCGFDLLPFKKNGYMLMSVKYNTGINNIEKNLSNFIARIWVCGNLENTYKYFGETINEDKGMPTNKQFIMTIIEKMKIERKSVS